MIKAVIIDLDDTLFLTEQAAFDLENEALTQLGLQPMGRQIHQDTWGEHLFDAIKVRSPGVDVASFKRAFDALLKDHVADGRIDVASAENIAALEKLKELRKSLVVLTSRAYSEVEHLLEDSHILARHIETFYYKDNTKYHKPDPRVFEHIEHEYGWKPEECVYVGDSLGDAAAAKGANLHFIACLESGVRKREDFKEYTVDAFIATFAEIVGAVQKLESKMSL
jgi:phosphoglycolate phosphatase